MPRLAETSDSRLRSPALRANRRACLNSSIALPISPKSLKTTPAAWCATAACAAEGFGPAHHAPRRGLPAAATTPGRAACPAPGTREAVAESDGIIQSYSVLHRFVEDSYLSQGGANVRRGAHAGSGRLILDNHEGAATYPAPERWDDVDDIDYLYREHAILARQPDAERVAAALGQILEQVGYGDVPEGDARQIRSQRVSTGGARSPDRARHPHAGTRPDPAPRRGTRAEAWPGRITMFTCAR